MRLTYEQIKEITCGAVSVEETEGGICFHRFTRQQRDMYQEKKTDFYNKSFATAGIKLSFRTDSSKLYLRALVKNMCTRTYCSFDVVVDGKLLGAMDNYTGLEIPKDYSQTPFPLGEMEQTFDLGPGKKQVVIHLPWNVYVLMQSLELDDGASVQAVKPEKKLLAFGDSITQGFDALRPSRRYISRLAEALNAEEINKAIGGECFCPELAALGEDIAPDYISVAYGTNDWSKNTAEMLRADSKAFFRELCSRYPNAKIYALTPIWRSNEGILAETREPFHSVEEAIRNAAAGLEQVTVIRGYDLVPHSVDFFGDYGLHPRNEGFDHYFENIMKAIG